MRNLWKLNNGQLVNISSQQTGTLKNGYTVSGYYALPADILTKEGWKPLIIDTRPVEVPEGYEAVWYYEQDDTTIYNRWQLEKLPEVIEEVEHEED